MSPSGERPERPSGPGLAVWAPWARGVDESDCTFVEEGEGEFDIVRRMVIPGSGTVVERVGQNSARVETPGWQHLVGDPQSS